MKLGVEEEFALRVGETVDFTCKEAHKLFRTEEAHLLVREAAKNNVF